MMDGTIIFFKNELNDDFLISIYGSSSPLYVHDEP